MLLIYHVSDTDLFKSVQKPFISSMPFWSISELRLRALADTKTLMDEYARKHHLGSQYWFMTPADRAPRIIPVHCQKVAMDRKFSEPCCMSRLH